MLENGTLYDIPDFRKEEDREKYENARLTPFYSSDGTAPSIVGSKREYYWCTDEGRAEYDTNVAEYRKSKEGE